MLVHKKKVPALPDKKIPTLPPKTGLPTNFKDSLCMFCKQFVSKPKKMPVEKAKIYLFFFFCQFLVTSAPVPITKMTLTNSSRRQTTVSSLPSLSR